MVRRFYKQEDRNTCGIAVLRSVLESSFGIRRSEEGLINLAERLYLEKCNGIPNQKEFEIRRYGTDVYHLVNVAEYFGLRCFSRLHGDIGDLKFLIDSGVLPIVHRPFEEDGDGHYVLPYDYNHAMYLFNPANGNGYGKVRESYPTFDEKWHFPNSDKRWFMFLYNGNVRIPFKGKYL